MKRPSHPFLLLLLFAVLPACNDPVVDGAPAGPNTPPSVLVVDLVGVQTGILPIAYTLTDLESSSTSVTAEWSDDDGASWNPATKAVAGGDGVSGLATSPAGTPHVFFWDSPVDGAGKPSQADVKFRLTPSDADPGAPDDTAFSVDNQVVAFRIVTLSLRDPHFYVRPPFGACNDFTDSGNGIADVPPDGVNGAFQATLTTDNDGDGFVDSAPLLLFRRFDPLGTGVVEFGSGRVAVMTPGTAGLDATAARVTATHSYVAMGTVLGPFGGTTKPYAPPVTSPAAPGFLTAPVSGSIPSGGSTLPMQAFQSAGTWTGDPVDGIVDGLLLGFISEVQASSLLINLGALGSTSLAVLLPGGTGNCSTTDDTDLGPGGAPSGWWFYFNFTAQRITYTGP